MDYKNYIPKDVKLTDADHKFIETHIKAHMPTLEVRISNPFSGVMIMTNPLIGTLVHMVQALSMSDFSKRQLSIWNLTEGNATMKFDRARSIVLKLDSNIYMQILD